MPLTTLTKSSPNIGKAFFNKAVWNKPAKGLEQLKAFNLGQEIGKNFKIKVPEMSAEALIKTACANKEFYTGFIKGFYNISKTNSSKDLMAHAKPFFDKFPELKEAIEKKDLADQSDSIHSGIKSIQNGIALKALNSLKIGHFEINQNWIHGKSPDFLWTKPDGTKVFVEFKTPYGPKLKISTQLTKYKSFSHKIAVDTRNIKKAFIKKPSIIYFDTTPQEMVLIHQARLKSKLFDDPLNYKGVAKLWDPVEIQNNNIIPPSETNV